MFQLENIKGIIFDYGGTIDSNGKHWAEVLWDAYVDCQIPVNKAQFREVYVFVERYLAVHPVIKADFDFGQLLRAKIKLQIENLVEVGYLPKSDKLEGYILDISDRCYTFSRNLIQKEMPILRALHAKYPVVLVSNFYGNIEAVLSDYGIDDCFDHIVESAVVGVRKPDPAIFTMGVEQLGLDPATIVVIGDSYPKDIVPARKNGCSTIWLKGIGWDAKEDPEADADLIIKDFMELKSIFKLD